ncbi:MAG: hypothetical protein HYT61_02310 [Candidatus Yanofskybacteria bacterium]|nr:hypothetical protein [Candidatus Yanofskybacteria bacterium]
MATLITSQTKLKRGDIVCVFGRVLGIVVRHESFLEKPGFYALNSCPGDKKFIRENGVDWYTRRHINDLIRDKAEIITRNELLSMYKKEPTSDLKLLLQMTKSRKNSKQ